jgi:uncharacterized protein (TIGR02996 family)
LKPGRRGEIVDAADAFLTDICEHPGEKVHWLAYADWLAERDLWTWETVLRHVATRPADTGPRLLAALWCETEGRQPGRGEFIRVQCELEAWGDASSNDLIAAGWLQRYDALRRRERELFDDHGPCWHYETIPYLKSSYAGEPLPSGHPSAALWRRGFFEAVSIPCDVFAGGRCGRCNGRKTLDSTDPGWPGPHPTLGPLPVECPDCNGTGLAPGYAATLFKMGPVREVWLSDKRPERHQPTAGSANWSWYLVGFGDDPATLPEALFDLLPEGWPGLSGQRLAYPTEQAATDALSSAALLLGCRLAWRCSRCDGDGQAHGADRPFEWSPEKGYPGFCPVCDGRGHAVIA